jgi:hypothetical protein
MVALCPDQVLPKYILISYSITSQYIIRDVIFVLTNNR